MSENENFTALDLFSGAGGMSLGLEDSGIKSVGAIESDRFACETYRTNFPSAEMLETEIKEFSSLEAKQKFEGCDMIVGGPPCQGFSVAGPSQYGIIDKKRNTLPLQMMRLVKELKPRLCIIENVKGILSGRIDKNKSALYAILNELEKLGYNATWQLLQAADFGVPQWRERVFIIGTRKGNNTFPEIKPVFGSIRRPWRTVGAAISDLPVIENSEGVNSLVPYTKNAENAYQKLMRKGSKGVVNHISMRHTPRILERFKHIPVGGSLVDVPLEYGQRLRNGTELDYKKRFKMNNQRLDPNKVSLAITASFQSNFVHPEKDRNLTAREGARFQSFPDRFVFCGPRTLMSKSLLKRENRQNEIGLSQYNQIGNAVPPLLAKAIGQVIVHYLKNC
tara:strand:+ start:960 stop:2138 length:1179 start_codon:yes stop_codon:yes gene_type:complete